MSYIQNNLYKSDPFDLPYHSVAGIDSNINYTGNVGISTTYTSTSELNNHNDVACFFNSTETGKLFFEFSGDDTNWGRFPVNGFDITANINEFHTAVKLPRYFRWAFQNESSTNEATLRANFYYGAYRQGNLPLNQSIGPDADSIVVRSVNIGENPLGAYNNIKGGGSAYRTTSNLAGTYLTSNLTIGQTGNFTVNDTTSFENEGYLYIDNEFIKYDQIVNSTTFNIPSDGRSQFFSTDVAHTSSNVCGEVYTSGILNLQGYQEVQTQFISSNTAQLQFEWFSDETGNTRIRSLNPTYTTTNNYDLLSAPTFGPYTRYIWANTENTDTTQLYFETLFLTSSLSAQVLTLNSGVFGSMTANLGRNVIAGKTEGGNYINAGITDVGEIFTNTLASNRSSRVVYESPTVTVTSYAILVDLSDIINFPHNQTNYLSIDHLDIDIGFASNNSSCRILIGVITDIDSTEATISYELDKLFQRANAKDGININENYQPSAVIFKSNTETSISNKSETTTSVNTSVTLDSPNGNIIAGLGDIIIKYEVISGNFEADVNIIYHSD